MRFRDIGDVRNELDELQSDPRSASASSTDGTHTSRLLFPWVAAATAITTLVAGTAGWMLKPAAPAESATVARFAHTLPQNQGFRNTGRNVVAVSPDGRSFVYNVSGGLALRSMDEVNARIISGTENTLTNPFFSPDGQWVGYWSDGQLKKISIAGGTAVSLCKAANPFGASWSTDNHIVFGQPQGIMRVSGEGGTPEMLVPMEKGEWADTPRMLPGGQWLLFSLTRGTGDTRWDVAEIVAQSLESGERRVLWRGGSDARYVPTGHLIYALDDTLFALRFDLERVRDRRRTDTRTPRCSARPDTDCKHRYCAIRDIRHRDTRSRRRPGHRDAVADVGLGRSERRGGSCRRSPSCVCLSAHLSRRRPGGARRPRPGQ
jgi:serine/threonine-protein kinase